MKKQLLDQAGHYFIGMLLAVIFHKVGVPSGMVASVILTLALLREMHQHRWDTNDLKQGSTVDMIFWTLGVLAGVSI